MLTGKGGGGGGGEATEHLVHFVKSQFSKVYRILSWFVSKNVTIAL